VAFQSFGAACVAAGTFLRTAVVIDAELGGVAALPVLAVAVAAIRRAAGVNCVAAAIILGADRAVLAAILADEAVADAGDVTALLKDVAGADLALFTADAVAEKIGIFFRAGSAAADLAVAALLAFFMRIGDALTVLAHLATVTVVVFPAAGSPRSAVTVTADLIVAVAGRFAGERGGATLAVAAA